MKAGVFITGILAFFLLCSMMMNVCLFDNGPTRYIISASMTGTGTLTPSGSVLVDSGADQSFTLSGTNQYADITWKLDGYIVQDSGTSYQLTNVTANHTLLVMVSTPG